MRDNERELRLRLYRLLLERYANTINEKETKTVGEIKGLVNANDLTVLSVVEEHKPENYEFNAHYLQCAESLYNFVCREISYVANDLTIDFWLNPKEILSARVADDSDMAVFLCSLLCALGDEKAEVAIAELDNAGNHAFVITEFQGKFFLLDPAQKSPFSEFAGNRENVLEKYSFRGAKIKRFLYKFNAQDYEQFI